MNDYAEIVALAEGLTEKIFISEILVPNLAERGILMTPIIISKPGQKGGEPENIDDSPMTSPSKRLEDLSDRFKKTSTGISIAKEIGLTKMRETCPLFNTWLTEIENLVICPAAGSGA